jgi:hypothetical protein
MFPYFLPISFTMLKSIRVDRENVYETSVAYRVIFRGQVSNVEITKDQAKKEIGEMLYGYIQF